MDQSATAEPTSQPEALRLYKRIDRKVPSRNIPILTRADWLKHAPPKNPIHIKDGRSAVELMNRWTPDGGHPAIPVEIKALLDSHELTSGTEITHGFAECTTSLYQSGGPRNHDLLLFGKGKSGNVVVAIEAKADETLDLTLNGKLAAAAGTILKNEATGLPERIDWLLQGLFASRCDTEGFRRRVQSGLPASRFLWDFSEEFNDGTAPKKELAELRYQLFSGAVGTLLEAKEEGSIAVFVVYEFRTTHTEDKKQASNSSDFQAFCNMFPSIKNAVIEQGRLYGPISLPIINGISKPLPQVPFLIGKVRVNLREP